jgi:hypothetical protein
MTADWTAAFLERGYAHFPRLVPAEMIDAARSAIQEELRLRYHAEREQEYSARTYCPDLLGTPPIMDLLQQSPVRDIVDAALGLDAVTWDWGQIAVRWAHNVERESPPAPHLDGFSDGNNGLEAGRIHNHTATVGVFLTTTPRAFAGNLTVWPGSHRLYEQYFRDRGRRALGEPQPHIDLGAPVQLICEAGDVVLLHYELAHTAAVNTSDVDRIAVYFRLLFPELDAARIPDLGERRWEYLADLWRGWRINDSA